MGGRNERALRRKLSHLRDRVAVEPEDTAFYSQIAEQVVEQRRIRGLSQQELAERLYVTKGNVSGLVDRLVEAGLVERRPLPGDRRSHALHLTDKGRELASQGIKAQRDYVERTLGRLKDGELAALDHLVGVWRDEARRDEAGQRGAQD